MFEAAIPGLDLQRLDNVRRRGNRVEAACPACREEGSDKSGDHLIIQPDGRYGCAAHPNDHEHRKRIWALVGGEIADPGSYLPPVPAPKAAETLDAYDWAFLKPGTATDLRRLSALRSIGLEGLELATRRGVLLFFYDKRNGRCWTITDSARHVRQDRRLDGKPFVLSDGRAVKARTIGRPAWPVGAAAATDKPVVAFCEGGPDVLAAFHLIATEGREADATAIAMLGQGQRIHPIALPALKGRRIRFFVHNDQPGREGVARWWRDLDGIAAQIDAFEFSGLQQADGSPVNDLNDFLHVDVEAWEILPHVRSPLPNDYRKN